MKATNLTKASTAFIILILSLSPLAFAQRTALPKDTLPEVEPILFTPQKTVARMTPLSSPLCTEPLQNYLAPVGALPKNALNKFTPEGAFYNDLFSGSAGYSYNIDVPPGVNGLSPPLSIAYNSHASASPGILGNGWSLSVSQISREINGTLSNTWDDIYSMNLNGAGSRLVYNDDTEKYHTKQESYLDISFYKWGGGGGSGGSGFGSSPTQDDEGEFWKVRAKDGTTYIFGSNPSTRHVSELQNYTSIWYLESINDTHDNTIEYTYIKNPASDSSVYLDRITYGVNEIIFNYIHDVQNGFNGYSHGARITQTTLLDNIEIRNNGALVRQYKFDYDAVDGEKLLKRIRYVGNDGTSELQPVEFAYYLNSKGWSEESIWALPSDAYLGSEIDEGVRLLDVNGDGLTDILKAKSSDHKVWYNTNNGFGTMQTLQGFMSGGFVDDIGHDKAVRALDINSDMKIDFLQDLSGVQQIEGAIVNTGDGFSTSEKRLPSGQSFALKTRVDSCEPALCPSGYKEILSGCDSVKCTRTCKAFAGCSDSWSPIWDNTYANWCTSHRCSVSTDSFKFCGSGVRWGGYSCSDEQEYCYQSTHVGCGANAESKIDAQSYYLRSHLYSLVSGCTEDEYDDSNWRCDRVDYSFCLPSGADCGETEHCRTDCWVDSLGGGIEATDFILRAWEDDCDGDDVRDYQEVAASITVFAAPVIWHIFDTECLLEDYPLDTGLRVLDINGDMEPDLVKAGNNDTKIWLRENGQWLETQDWILPHDFRFVEDDKDGGGRIVDVNGDGLPDLLKAKDSVRKAWLNTGGSWILDNTWAPPSDLAFVLDNQSSGVEILDINWDGLSDIVLADDNGRNVWINTGKGWSEDSAWLLPPEVVLNYNGVKLSDINGDGLPDVIKAPSSGDRKTWVNKYSKQYLLKEVKGAAGGKVTLDYQRISNLDNTGSDDISDLAFNGWVISSIKTDNAISGIHNLLTTTTLDYSSGLFDPEDKEFRGFAEVEETRPDGSRVKHWFHQDDAKKGIEYQSKLFDENNNLYTMVKNNFTHQEESGYYMVTLDSASNYFYEGKPDAKITRKSFEYDHYGNVIKMSYLGDISETGDEKYTYLDYTYDTDKWIVSTPNETRLLAADDSTLISTETYKYNAFGDVTEEENWLADGPNPVTKYEYDSYGNLRLLTDANEYTTEYDYDATNTFVEKVTDSKTHETTYDYDQGTGNLLSATDPNGYIVEYRYDVFGRKTKEILPYDSDSYPTVGYVYDLNGTPPESITVRQKENDYGTLDSFYHYDGFGNLIQQKTESDDFSFIVSDIFYDALGRTKHGSNPYYSMFPDYTEPDTSVKKTVMEYDVLGRTTKITKPDMTSSSTEYDHWTATVYDENGHQTKYIADAYDNIIMVKEHNEGDVYTTTYEYGTTGELLEITDNKGNSIQYEYDTLGRKTKFDDPDLGLWTYEYDSAGNLIQQTDNRGNEVRMTYDELGRILTRTAPDTSITYTYDVDVKGTLSSIEAPGITKSYEYDQRLRTVSVDKIIDGITFTTSSEYDSMDRVTSVTLPNDEVVEFDYSDSGSLDSIQGVITDIAYNAFGQPTEKHYSNSLVSEFNYDPDNAKLMQIRTNDKQNLNYGYDDKNNVLQIDDLKNNNTEAFTYDDLDRLKTANSAEYDIVYEYDSIGNLLNLTSNQQNLSFTYSAHAPIRFTIDSPNPVPEGDINKDCKVDILDLAAAGIAFGSSPEDGNWNPGADVNKDNEINIIDMATVARNFGATC